MQIPKLKRIKVYSTQELQNWLRGNPDLAQDVMIVTCAKPSSAKHVSSNDVRRVLGENGWSAGMAYTLPGGLKGHVATCA